MKATQMLHNLGQSIWLDNITRELLDSGTLKRYIDDLSVTGLTSNPTIFDNAMTHGNSYDKEIAKLTSSGLSAEDAFFEMAIEDLRRHGALSGFYDRLRMQTQLAAFQATLRTDGARSQRPCGLSILLCSVSPRE